MALGWSRAGARRFLQYDPPPTEEEEVGPTGASGGPDEPDRRRGRHLGAPDTGPAADGRPHDGRSTSRNLGVGGAGAGQACAGRMGISRVAGRGVEPAVDVAELGCCSRRASRSRSRPRSLAGPDVGLARGAGACRRILSDLGVAPTGTGGSPPPPPRSRPPPAAPPPRGPPRPGAPTPPPPPPPPRPPP